MLKKKLYRDLRQNMSQFIVIFVMVMLAVLAFSGVHAYMDGMRVSSEEIYSEYNLADMWLTGEGFSQEEIEKVRASENVNAADRRLTFQGNLEGRDDVTLEMNFLESNDVCRMYVFDGEAFAPDNTDGVWVDKEFAAANGYAVGDQLTLRYTTYKIDVKIAGLVETPDHAYSIKDATQIFPDHKTYGYVYLSYKAIPDEILKDAAKAKLGGGIFDTSTHDDVNTSETKSSDTEANDAADSAGSASDKTDSSSSLLGAITGSFTDAITDTVVDTMLDSADLHDQIPFPYIMVDLKDPDLFDETKEQLESSIDSIIAVTSRSELASWVGYNSEVEEGETYSFVFTFLLLFIAILSVITTMNRFIKKERVQIGTLKALGYRRKKIVWHYICYNLVLSVIAAAAGIVLGALLIGRFFLKMEMDYFEMPEAHLVLEPIVFITAALSVLVIVFVTWLSCRKILNEPASQALRTEVPSVKNTKFSLTTTGIFSKASTVTKWNLRDIGRNKGRSIAGIAGTMGCVMLVVTALGMHDTIEDFMNWQFNRINQYKSYMVLSADCTDKEYDALTEKYGDASSETIAIEMEDAEGKAITQTIFVNEAPGFICTSDFSRQPMELGDDGMYITRKLSESLKLGVGDEFTFRVYGEEGSRTAKICGIYRDPQSQQFTCTRKYMESLGMTYRADTIYSGELLDVTDVPEGVDVIQTKEGLETGVRGMMDRMTTIIALFIVLSAVLSVVILYNLGILSFTEKQYQFATLKVLGYRTKPLRRIFNQQGRILSIISIAMGLPAGYFMISYIFREALGDNYDFPAYVRPISYVLAGAAIFLVSCLVNEWLSGRIRKIDMVSSLKANE